MSSLSAALLLTVLSAGPVRAGVDVSTSACAPGAFEALGRSKVGSYETLFEACTEGEDALLSLRGFKKAGTRWLLLADPATLKTSVRAASCVRCRPAGPADLPEKSPYARALKAAGGSAALLQNAGLRGALSAREGYFLSVDLCPSPKKGFDGALFTGLERAGALSGERPLPVALSVSGAWLKRHPGPTRWLREQERSGALSITWVNHTLHHPFDRRLPLEHNFLLKDGVDPREEVLGLERLLLAEGLVPSVFFRFPGLVSDGRLLALVSELHLVALGSGGWLAKGQMPRPGAVILIHGNMNEHEGIREFFEWLHGRRGSLRLLPVGSIAD